MQERPVAEGDAVARWRRRLALPVIVAAAVSVPAVFLTMLDHPYATRAGYVLNWLSVAVLTAEAALLVLVSRDRRAFLWRHRWTLAITVVAVPAVIFAVAPVQALRLLQLLRLVGTLRILRARTIFKAGTVLARRLGITGRGRYALVLAGSLLAAVFVALVLVDPTANRRHQQVLQELLQSLGPVPVLVAGVILAVATFLVVRYRRRDASADRGDTAGDEGADEGADECSAGDQSGR